MLPYFLFLFIISFLLWVYIALLLLLFFFEVLEGRSIDYQFKPFPFSQCMHWLLWMSFIILPHKSRYVVRSYSFNLMFTLISLEISFWLLDYLHCVISKCFREFSVIFLLLIFYFDSVVFQEHTLFIILVLLNMLSFILWPRIWFILVYVPRALEKKVHPAVIGQNILYCRWDPTGWWWCVLHPCWFSL